MTQAPPPPPGQPPTPPGVPPQPWSGGPPPGAISPGPVAARPQTSGLAVASLVTGLFFWCFWVPGIVSIVLGHLALEQIGDSGGVKRGRGMAIAGIVLGWVGIGIVGLVVLTWFVTVVSS